MDDRLKLIEDARKPVKEIVDRFLEGMITKEEAFDQIVLLYYSQS